MGDVVPSWRPHNHRCRVPRTRVSIGPSRLAPRNDRRDNNRGRFRRALSLSRPGTQSIRHCDGSGGAIRLWPRVFRHFSWIIAIIHDIWIRLARLSTAATRLLHLDSNPAQAKAVGCRLRAWFEVRAEAFEPAGADFVLEVSRYPQFSIVRVVRVAGGNTFVRC